MRNSVATSATVAPIVFSRTKARAPKVLGKSQLTPCHIPGILLCGHDTPDMKSKGTEMNTTSSITFSRYFTIHDITMPKKMQAMTKGVISVSNDVHVASCGKWNIRGMAAQSHVPITA